MTFQNITLAERGFHYTNGNHLLYILVESPTPEDIVEFQQGLPQFAFSVKGSLIRLYHRFGKSHWRSEGYNYHARPAALPPSMPPAKTPEQTLFRVVLVEFGTYDVIAVRTLALPRKFVAKLHRAIRKQAEHPAPNGYMDKLTLTMEIQVPMYANIGDVQNSVSKCIGKDVDNSEMPTLTNQEPLPKLEIGEVSISKTVTDSDIDTQPYLERHQNGDWGAAVMNDNHDRWHNEKSVRYGGMVVSCYETSNGRIFVQTAPNRSETTIQFA